MRKFFLRNHLKYTLLYLNLPSENNTQNSKNLENAGLLRRVTAPCQQNFTIHKEKSYLISEEVRQLFLLIICCIFQCPAGSSPKLCAVLCNCAARRHLIKGYAALIALYRLTTPQSQWTSIPSYFEAILIMRVVMSSISRLSSVLILWSDTP